MNREFILYEIDKIKRSSKTTQASLLKELKTLEAQEKSKQNRKRMGEISIAHSIDLWNTTIKVLELESMLKHL